MGGDRVTKWVGVLRGCKKVGRERVDDSKRAKDAKTVTCSWTPKPLCRHSEHSMVYEHTGT